MKLTTGLLNYTGTPGAYTNTFANRPGATAVPTGTLYFSNDTNILYQTNGSSWISYSGGGGSQNLASVLTAGNTATNTIILSTVGGQILEYSGNSIDNGSVLLFWGSSQEEIAFKINGGNLYGVAIDFRTGVNTTYLGDVQQSRNGTEMWINDNAYEIKTFSNRSLQPLGLGLQINFNNGYYNLGDFAAYNDGTCIKINDPSQKIELFGANTYFNTILNAKYDVNFDGEAFNLTGITGGTALINFNHPSFSSNTAGGNSGKHLIIYLQGVQYKISLLNP